METMRKVMAPSNRRALAISSALPPHCRPTDLASGRRPRWRAAQLMAQMPMEQQVKNAASVWW